MKVLHVCPGIRLNRYYGLLLCPLSPREAVDIVSFYTCNIVLLVSLQNKSKPYRYRIIIWKPSIRYPTLLNYYFYLLTDVVSILYTLTNPSTPRMGEIFENYCRISTTYLRHSTYTRSMRKARGTSRSYYGSSTFINTLCVNVDAEPLPQPTMDEHNSRQTTGVGSLTSRVPVIY